MAEDYDPIDYTQANTAEAQRCQRSEVLIQTAKYARDKVRTGFITDEEYREFKGQDIIFDVLPSFEMYQSVQNRSECIPAVLPPDYFGGDLRSVSPRSDLSTTVLSLSSPSSRASASSYSTPSTPSADVFEPLGATVRNVVDNIHKLPSMPVHPHVIVDIHITKSAPQPLEKSEAESVLKEYTSGSAVHGYVIVSNESSNSVPFQMFNITLEGRTSVMDPTTGKIRYKRFLNMVDMNASWTFGSISPSTNVLYEAGMKDWDGCIIGFNNKRILEPKTKYKKFFYFKVPYTLLDNTCSHQEELHTLLPPSFGIDRYINKGKYSNITINSALHYGHDGTRGSPVLTKDLSNGKLSVSYCVNAILIGSHPTLRDDIGQPELAIMRSEQYALRFIPFGFTVNLFSSKRPLETLKRVVESSLKNAERFLRLNEEGSEEDVRKLDYDIKIQQLHIDECIRDSREKYAQRFPLRNERPATSDFSKIETPMVYVSQLKKSLFSKPKQLSESGLIQITTHIPKDGLAYVSPPLIRKANHISVLNELSTQNIDSLTNSLSMNEKQELKYLDFQLKFNPSHMSLSGQAPEISRVTSSLLVINSYSKSTIPIKLSSDILLDRNEGLQEIKSQFAKYNETLDQLRDRFLEKGFSITEFVDISTQEDIMAMKEMKCDTFKLPVFKSKVEHCTPWSNMSGLWVRDIKLSLSYRGTITETLVPNFQVCQFSRIYCIQVDFKFKHCSKFASVYVPIRLRWLDNDG